MAILEGHSEKLESVNYPDGNRIVTASMDKTARIWDAESGEELAIRRSYKYVLSANYSPDGKRIVTEWTPARIWMRRQERSWQY